MDLAYRELLYHTITALNSFDPESMAQEAHINSYLKCAPELEEDDQVFVVEVFSGCVRYSNVLKVMVKGFYNRDGKSVLRSEENLYRVVAYLALFRLDELGIAHFRKFVRSLDINRMYKFLNFAFSDKNLRTWIKNEWCKLYELSFVQNTLLGPILRWLPDIEELLQNMKDKIEDKLPPQKQHISTTAFKREATSCTNCLKKPQPFKLTQPRPRSVPLPEPIPRLKSSKPVPKSQYQDPKEDDFLSRIKQENRHRAEERLMDANVTQPACAGKRKSTKTRQRLEELAKEQDAKLDFNKSHYRPVPNSMLSDNIPIKLNAATILREGQLYKKREAEELKKIEDIEAGAFDSFEFTKWETRMKKMDKEAQLAEVERRKLAGKLSREEAMLAKQLLTNENQRKAQEMKEEAGRLMNEYLERKLKEDEIVRSKVERVTNAHENAKDAKKKLQQYKAKIVEEMSQEYREMMKRALQEAEKEMQQKMDIISQIRSLENRRFVRQAKTVDLTECANHGLLVEMSTAELRERLRLMKIGEQEAEEEKRDVIMSTKQAKDEMLMNTLETISRHRTENSRAAAVRLETRKKYRDDRVEVEDEKLTQLKQKLEERKQERLRQQQKNQLLTSKKSAERIRQLSKTKKLTEEKRWEELEMTRERTVRLNSQGVAHSAAASRIANRQLLTGCS